MSKSEFLLDGQVVTSIKWDFAALKHDIHENSRAHGWWDEPTSFAHFIALCHAELSEAVEADRKGGGPSDHIPEFTAVEEELADCIIRILDRAGGMGYRIGEAILAKHEFNKGRPFRHGKLY